MKKPYNIEAHFQKNKTLRVGLMSQVAPGVIDKQIVTIDREGNILKTHFFRTNFWPYGTKVFIGYESNASFVMDLFNKKIPMEALLKLGDGYGRKGSIDIMNNLN